MDSTLQNIIRLGRVSSTDPAKATVRVLFEDKDNMVSYDLPVIMNNTLKNKDYYMPDVGESVVCIFLPNGLVQGFVLGAVYSEVDKPPINSQDKRHIRFDDGTTVEYDRSKSSLAVDCVGDINIKAGGKINMIASGKITINGATVDIN